MMLRSDSTGTVMGVQKLIYWNTVGEFSMGHKTPQTAMNVVKVAVEINILSTEFLEMEPMNKP